MNYLRGLARSAVQLESWWFDTLHRVNTRATQQDLAGESGDLSKGFWYIPTRPSIARKILGQLPIEHLESYCFVDFGSGKGRLLFNRGRASFCLRARGGKGLGAPCTSRRKSPQRQEF